MPEIPDIEVFAFNRCLPVKKLTKIKVVNGNKLKDTSEELSQSLPGSVLQDIYRSGK